MRERWLVGVGACVGFGVQGGCSLPDGCDESRAESSWEGLAPSPNALAAGGPLTAVVDAERVWVTAGGSLQALDIAVPDALAVSPDGVGMAFGYGPSARRFEAGSPAGPAVVFDDNDFGYVFGAAHDGTAFVVAYLAGPMLEVARLDRDAAVLGPAVQITDPFAFARELSFAAGPTTFVLMPSGDDAPDADPCRWAVRRIRDQALVDAAEIVVETGEAACADAGIAAHGDTAVVVLGTSAYPIAADGSVGAPVNLGTTVRAIVPVAGGYLATRGFDPDPNPYRTTVPVVVLGLDGAPTATIDVEAERLRLAAAGDAARIVIRRDDLDELGRTGTSQLLVADMTAAGVGPERVLVDNEVELVNACDR
jgi:hypothetical protein